VTPDQDLKEKKENKNSGRANNNAKAEKNLSDEPTESAIPHPAWGGKRTNKETAASGNPETKTVMAGTKNNDQIGTSVNLSEQA
jgi:hypothetical protein